jgi:hypothetical protein
VTIIDVLTLATLDSVIQKYSIHTTVLALAVFSSFSGGFMATFMGGFAANFADVNAL